MWISAVSFGNLTYQPLNEKSASFLLQLFMLKKGIFILIHIYLQMCIDICMCVAFLQIQKSLKMNL